MDTLRRGLALIPDNKYGGTRDQHPRVLIYNLDHTASIPLSEGYEKLGEYAAAIECLGKPVNLLISYEKYAEAIALVRRAEEIVKEHAVEVSPTIAGLLNRLKTKFLRRE